MPTREELESLVESGDVYGLMLAAARGVLARYYPDAEYMNITAHIRDGIPDVQIPVTPCGSCALPPRRA